MERSYKFRIYPTEAQQEQIEKTFGCCRFVYNHYLTERIRAYSENGTQVSRFEQDRNLPALKKEAPWLGEVDARALQSVLQDLDRAYQDYFGRRKKGVEAGFPKYKSKRERRKSYRTKGTTLKLLAGKVQLPKLDYVECEVSQGIEGRIIAATVSRVASGKYYVSLRCTDVGEKAMAKTARSVEIEVGEHGYIVTSDGKRYENHGGLAKTQKRINRAQRELARKASGGENREKARIRLAELYEKLTNQRNDTLRKLTTEIVRNYDAIRVKNQRARDVVKNCGNVNHVEIITWYEFVRQLEYKCRWYGKELVKTEAEGQKVKQSKPAKAE